LRLRGDAVAAQTQQKIYQIGPWGLF